MPGTRRGSGLDREEFDLLSAGELSSVVSETPSAGAPPW
jgi:hypothetical protein